MSSLKLDRDEIILNTFTPPRRAAYYSLIKKSPVKLIFIALLFYYILNGIYTSNPVVKSPLKASGGSALSIPPQNINVPSQLVENQSYPPLSATKTWHYSGSYHGTGVELKPYLLKMLAFFLLFYLYWQIRKQSALVGSLSYTITNKRILVRQMFPKQELHSVNYINAHYTSKQQTPIHWLLNLYFISLSSEEIKKSTLNAIGQFNFYPSNDVVDLLTLKDANYLLDLFEQSKKGTVPLPAQKVETLSVNPNHFSKKMIFRSQPYYILFLLPKYWMLYGVWVMIALLCLFAGVLHQLGFYSAAYAYISQYGISSLLLSYTLFFLVLAYLRSAYRVKHDEYIFTQEELIIPRRIDLLTTQKIIPYRDIINVNSVYSGFNLYTVTFTAKLKKQVLGRKNQFAIMRYNLKIPGLSKENADQIALLLSQSLS